MCKNVKIRTYTMSYTETQIQRKKRKWRHYLSYSKKKKKGIRCETFIAIRYGLTYPSTSDSGKKIKDNSISDYDHTVDGQNQNVPSITHVAIAPRSPRKPCACYDVHDAVTTKGKKSGSCARAFPGKSPHDVI